MKELPISFTPLAIMSRLGSDAEILLSSALSHAPNVDRSSLLKQLSLHLPRLETRELYDSEYVAGEARRLANRLATLQTPYLKRVPGAGSSCTELSDFHFCKLQEDIARPILKCFHYILSYRESSHHFCLRSKSETDEWPVMMASVSEFDLGNVKAALTNKWEQMTPAMVLSRVFAFPAAPRNAFSFLMSRVRQWLTNYRPDVQLLLTYVNPNLGFSAASYKADNWKLLGEEHGTRYLYLDGDYKTDRFLHAYFGQPIDPLLWTPGSRISASKHRLMPLKIYMRSVSNSEAVQGHYYFDRWCPS